MGPKTKKKAKKSPLEKILDKIRKEMNKLEKLQEKGNDIVEKINDLLDEDRGDDEDWDISYGGTDD